MRTHTWRNAAEQQECLNALLSQDVGQLKPHQRQWDCLHTGVFLRPKVILKTMIEGRFRIWGELLISLHF